jgi:hypothetical protein
MKSTSSIPVFYDGKVKDFSSHHDRAIHINISMDRIEEKEKKTVKSSCCIHINVCLVRKRGRESEMAILNIFIGL